MVLTENVEVPEPTFLYTALKVCDPGVKPVISADALARTGSLPNTRSEFASEAPGSLPSTLTDMKPAVCPVLPNICAVRITNACVPVGSVTDGPGVARSP
jgi:hypothetical protein